MLIYCYQQNCNSSKWYINVLIPKISDNKNYGLHLCFEISCITIIPSSWGLSSFSI